MGVERTTACWAPLFYMKHMRKKSIVVNIITALTILLFCGIALVILITNGNRRVKFDCGRKATFSDGFGQALYCFETFGYVTGLILNIVAYIGTRSVINADAAGDQLKRLRYYVAVAAISTLLVAVPDIKQLLIYHIKEANIDEWISQMFNWLCIIASSFNIFVYIALSRDFRREFLKCFRIRRRFLINVVSVKSAAGKKNSNTVCRQLVVSSTV